MQIRMRLAMFCLVIALAACSRVATNWDYDPTVNFSTLRTYGWRSGSTAQWEDPRFDAALFDSRVRMAVDNALAAKGYRKRDSPDFLVGYHAVVEERQDVRTIDQTYGYPGSVGYAPRAGWRHYGRGPARGGWSMETETRTEVVSYKQGTLILDIVDADSGKLLWRGSTEGVVEPGADPQERQARLEKIVAQILDSFPPE